MREPLIGIWWYTDKRDLLGLRQLPFSGSQLGIYRVSPYTYESGWKLCLSYQSEYYGKDPSNFQRGQVIYNTVLNHYCALCESEELLHDEDFKTAVIKEFHLENTFYEFEKYIHVII